MQEADKDKLEKLETLREQALFAPEGEREQALSDYEELRAQLFCVATGETTEQAKETRKLPTAAQTLTCESCGKLFPFREADRQFYEGQSTEGPKVCPGCRQDMPMDKSDIKGEGGSGGDGAFNS